MNTVTIIKLYDLLIPKLGKEAAENLTTFIENKISNELENSTKILATKEDLAIVKKDLALVREDLANVKSEVIRWMFLFWIGQLAGTIGIILLFVKK
jgi:hypothetical protein